MRVLVACEFSGIVRDAFIAKGHEAVNCDILPTESNGPHYQGDVFDIINDGWDMMLAFPPCTYLTNAGIRHFNVERYGKKAVNRWHKRIQAFDFVMRLAWSDIPKICIENPVGFLNSAWRKPDQIVHPYYFGEEAVKRTCLWLKGLEPLWWCDKPNLLSGVTAISKPEPLFTSVRSKSDNFEGGEIKKHYFVQAKEKHGGTSNGHQRSKIFGSIAQAMADQWGDV